MQKTALAAAWFDHGDLEGNMEMYLLIPLVVVLCAVASYAGWYMNARSGQNRITSTEERAKKILADAERDASAAKREKLLEVKDEWYRKKQEFDSENQSKRNKLEAYEKQLSSREENIDRKVELLNRKEKELSALRKDAEEKSSRVEQKQTELKQLLEDENVRLERVSGMTREEAKKILMENMYNEAKTESTQALKEIRDRTREESKREAQKIIVQAIQR
ncbi:MAG TPA: Rnase Y domain-containing protein, partial [Bacteroidota bacterium]